MSQQVTVSNTGNGSVSRPRRFQFTIRWLLAVTAIVGVFTMIIVGWIRQREIRLRPVLWDIAIRNGDVAEVDRLLKIDPQLARGLEHYNHSSSHTPLQRALLRRHSKIIDRILQEHLDLDEKNTGGETALHTAIASGMPYEAVRLLQLGANANAKDKAGTTPLHMTVERGGPMVQLLIDNGADPNLARTDGKTPLHLAVERRQEPVVDQLLKAGARVNVCDPQGRTPLHLAFSQGGSLKLAQLLVEHGGDLTAADRAGLIPGQHPDGSNSEIAARIWWKLIESSYKEGEVTWLDKALDAAPQALSFRTEYSPVTLLDRAICAQQLELLDYLLARCRKANLQSPDLGGALHTACSGSSPDYAERLLNAGADIEAKDPFGRTPLHQAARKRNSEVLRLLIARGANMGALDKAGTTVLDSLFERGFHQSSNQESIDVLRRAGHPPTVLFASVTGDLELLRQLSRDDLLALNRSYNRDGVTPLHAAIAGGQRHVVEWLVQRGVDINALKPAGPGINGIDTPLMTALSYNQTELSLLLIQLGADVNCKCISGHYAVHAVIDWDRGPAILAALLRHNVDLKEKYQNKTAIDLARESRSAHRARYLEMLEAGQEQ